MLTPEGWKHFEDNPHWREIVDTIKIRMALIQQDIIRAIEQADGSMQSIANLKALQSEYKTCNWLITLPDEIVNEGAQNESNS